MIPVLFATTVLAASGLALLWLAGQRREARRLTPDAYTSVISLFDEEEMF